MSVRWEGAKQKSASVVGEVQRSQVPGVKRPQRKASRRRFLKLAGGVVGVTVLAGAGGITIGLQEPEISLPSASFGKETSVTGKILVAYASKCGSTAEVAAEVAKVLASAGSLVDVRPAKEVKDLGPYRAVVLGSAVRMGGVLSEVKDFAKNNRAALALLPTAYFTLGTTMKQDTPANRETALGFLKPLREVKEPVSVGLFAGKVDYSKLSPIWRFMASKDSSGTMAEGDFRNWDAIRAWAREVHPLLAQA